MRQDVSKVLIAGGTGFIGYHAALLFLSKNIDVSTIALPNEIDLEGWYPPQINLMTGNLFEMSMDEITLLVKNHNFDTFVYALGPDDRTLPIGDAFAFFHEKLVVQSTKICQAIKNAGIKRCIVLSSYFAHFDRIYHNSLSKHHPYIRARLQQQFSLFELTNRGTFDVMMLELPFIFGTMPNRVPLWREHFLSLFDGMKKLYFPKGGGTSVISVEGVAEAIVATAFYGESNTCYPIGIQNMTYRHLIETMTSMIGDKRQFVGVPAWITAIGAAKLDKKMLKDGKQSGLNHRLLMTDILNKLFYIDPDFMKERLHFEELGFEGGIDIYKSLADTMKACYPEKFN